MPHLNSHFKINPNPKIAQLSPLEYNRNKWFSNSILTLCWAYSMKCKSLVQDKYRKKVYVKLCRSLVCSNRTTSSSTIATPSMRFYLSWAKLKSHLNPQSMCCLSWKYSLIIAINLCRMKHTDCNKQIRCSLK
jgi:hypothetical protein